MHEGELSQLENKSRLVLAGFRARRLVFGRPVMEEVCGTPRSGKTMVIRKSLRRFLRQTGWRVSLPQEGAERIETPRSDGFLYNLHTAVYALDQLLYLRHDQNFDLVILDRALFDAIVRAKYWFQVDKIDRTTSEITTAFYSNPKIRGLIDKTIVLVCSPEVALQREDAFALTTERSSSVNEDSLKHLLDIHRSTYDYFTSIGADVSWIDTSEMDMQKEGIVVAHSVLDAIADRIGLVLEE